MVGGVTLCLMRENGMFSSDHKASEHLQNGAGPYGNNASCGTYHIIMCNLKN